MADFREKIRDIVFENLESGSHYVADAILALPEIAKVENLMSFTVALQAKLAEVEAERDEWKGIYEQADRHHMEAERSTEAAKAALPRYYQKGLDAAAEAIRTLTPPADLVEKAPETKP